MNSFFYFLFCMFVNSYDARGMRTCVEAVMMVSAFYLFLLTQVVLFFFW